MDKLVRMTFAMNVQCPRVKLMTEAGLPWRLATSVLCRAIALESRLALQPEDNLCKRLLTMAADHVMTWAAAVERERVALGIPRADT